MHTSMALVLPQQLSACKCRIELARSLIKETNANGYKSLEAELALLLETDLLEKLEALLSTEARLSAADE